MTSKTPINQDKRLFLAAGTILLLVLARHLGTTLEPELLATIAATVLGYTTNSAVKEATIAKAIAQAGKAPPPA